MSNPAACSCDSEAFDLGPEGQRRYFPDRGCAVHGDSEWIAIQKVAPGKGRHAASPEERTPSAPSASSNHAASVSPFDALARVAALFVYSDGVYAGQAGVDVWGEDRDARLYDGPWPVVAHPPCKSWSIMSNCRPEIVKGEDGGCFEAALRAVRTFGGVLEHPAHTRAWKRFGLPKPLNEGWTRSLNDPGWTCAVDQRQYGHEANKPTWLYFVGDDPPVLIWGRAAAGEKTVGRSWGQGRDKKRSATPLAFRDVLLAMARSAARQEVAA